MSDSRFLPIGLAQVQLDAAVLTRPADTTAYASGDLIANSTTAGAVAALQFQNATRAPGRLDGRIIGARIRKSTVTTANGVFRLHFFNSNPVATAPTNGDNGVFAPAAVVLAAWVGFIDIDFTAQAVVSASNATARGFPAAVAPNGIPFSLLNPDTPTLFGLLEARGAYAPGNAETFHVSVDLLQE
jgi:hypothetical protein